MNVKKQKIAKWKIYSGLVALIAVVSFGFAVFTAWATYPTMEHRQVAQELAVLNQKAFGSNNVEKITNSDEYKALNDSRENVYSIRMGIGSSVLSAVIGVAMVVAVYRYLRRNRITIKAVGATVLIDTIAMAIIALPIMYVSDTITGIKTEPVMMVMLLISLPFSIGISALLAFVIAKIAEWHYNRSHGFIEE